MAELYTQVSIGLILGSVARAVISAGKLKRLNWLPIVVACAAVVPVLGLSVGRWIYSFTGPVSLPMTILLGWTVIKPLVSTTTQHVEFCSEKTTLFRGAKGDYRAKLNQQSLVTYWSIISFLSLTYFPLAFGWTNFDPHAWGWYPSFIYVPCAIAASCIWRGQPGLAVAFMVAGAAWKLQLFDATNGWSYLVDPIAACISLFSLVSHAANALLKRNAKCHESETATQGCSPIQSRAA